MVAEFLLFISLLLLSLYSDPSYTEQFVSPVHLS